MGNNPKTINAFDLNEWFNSEYENPIIIDVREDSELEIAIFPKQFLHLPISKVSPDYVKTKIRQAKDKKFVVICHAGIRSFNFGQWSLDNNLVKGILVNIFGGIMRCDVIAEGIIAAAKDLSISVPLVVRLEGTNVDKGKEILDNSGIDIISATDLDDAAKKIVELV